MDELRIKNSKSLWKPETLTELSGGSGAEKRLNLTLFIFLLTCLDISS